jgi:hypothetical protein
VSQVSEQRRATVLGSPRTHVDSIVIGTSLGMLAGVFGLMIAMALNRWAIREVAALDYLVLFPMIGGLAAFAHWNKRRPQATSDASELPDLDGSPDAEQRRRERRGRYLLIGLAGGCGLALIATLADFAWRGWVAMGSQAAFHMLLFPYVCILFAFRLSREPGEKFSLRNLQWKLQTIMILVAYLALLFGVAAEGRRLGGAAERYHNQYLSAVSMAKLFRGFAEKNTIDAPIRRKNAELLRAGQIPEDILEVQRTFLKSLDKTATADYRKYRYGLIADGEDLQLKSAESNIAAFEQLTRYYDQLADKYSQAEKQPWKPVPPDPPRP